MLLTHSARVILILVAEFIVMQVFKHNCENIYHQIKEVQLMKYFIQKMIYSFMINVIMLAYNLHVNECINES